MGKIIDRVREREGRRFVRELEEARRLATIDYLTNHPAVVFCDWVESWWRRAFTTPSWMRKPDEPAAAIRNGGGE